ncbi:MAG: hypothetical protein AAFR98_12490 [Pseudomonadota bacterium]
MHDKERKRAQSYAKRACSTLIKNNKFYVAPQRETANFKQLFARLAAAGAGRPVDKDGFPDGPWTPESLADAISAIEGNRDGIEVRSVQVWFQDNDNGISDANIRWLARIFGCDDPEAASAWQAELKAAKERLASERRDRKAASAQLIPSPLSHTGTTTKNTDVSTSSTSNRLVLGISRLVASSSNLYLPIFVWAGWAVLAVLATLLSLGDVTYRLDGGLDKNVGFYRSPVWTIEKLVLIPLFLAITSRAVMNWHARRSNFEADVASMTWEERIVSYKLAFIAVVLVCVIIVFGLQWYGSYLKPLLDGSNTSVVPNWLRVTTNPVSIVPLRTAISVSLFAGMYIGCIYWLCFSGLLLLYISSHDFVEFLDSEKRKHDGSNTIEVQAAAQDLVRALYRSIVCGILMSMTIKVSVVYLDTDALRFSSWIIGDLMHGLGFDEPAWHWSGPTQLATLTSLLFLFAIASVSYLAIYRIKLSMEASQDTPFITHGAIWWAPILMLLGFQSIGLYVGFSVVFLIGLLVGIWQILHPRLPFNPRSNNDERRNETHIT